MGVDFGMNDQRAHRGRFRANQLGLTIPVLTAVVVAAALVAFHEAPGHGRRQWGVNVLVADNCYQAAAAWKKTATNEIRSVTSLGANSIAFAFPFYTKDIHASSVFTQNRCPPHHLPRTSPSPARLAVLVRAAHRAGLDVMLRPLLDEMHLAKWRGAIAPKSEAAWFVSYAEVLRPYLQMAEKYKVERFGISAELNSLAKSEYWSPLVKFARKFYSGRLVQVATWPPSGRSRIGGTSFGVDAYPRLRHLNPSASVAQIRSGWDTYLHDHRLPSGTPLYEVGIKAVNGAYALPSNFGRPHATFNEQVQANWFTAACTFVKSHNLGGFYVWGPDIRFNHGNLMSKPLPKKGSQLQPAAQAAVRKCFQDRG
jgi:hypothetical protein